MVFVEFAHLDEVLTHGIWLACRLLAACIRAQFTVVGEAFEVLRRRLSESDTNIRRAQELKDAIDRYIRYKSTDGKGESGYYVNSAKPVLMQFYNWCRDTGHADLSRLGDETEGPDVMRKYAKRLNQRESVDAITAGTARTYWNIISGFMSDARDDGDLSINPCLRKRAKDPLPTNTDNSKQQFWDDSARAQILRHVDQEAHAAIDEHGMDAGTPVRDRALVYLLAYTGVRGAEVLRASKDDRDGRQGLRWKHVDLEGGKIRVFRKTQRWEWSPLPTQAQPAVERWKTVLDPPTGEWPVFPTSHAPSLYQVARGIVGNDADLSDVDVDELLREHECPPPAITVDAARRRVKKMCEAAGIEIDGEYLKLHGARRGIGHTLFKKDRGEAQDLLGHQNPETTKQAYSDRVPEERSERVSDLLDE